MYKGYFTNRCHYYVYRFNMHNKLFSKRFGCRQIAFELERSAMYHCGDSNYINSLIYSLKPIIMKKKVFSLMMTLLLAFIGVAKADVVTIGEGTSTTYYGPFNSLWGYSFVEQIYTADEIGTAGTITSISFNMSRGSFPCHGCPDVWRLRWPHRWPR